MLLALSTFIVVVLETALVTYVVTQSGINRLSLLFSLLVSSFVVQHYALFVQAVLTTDESVIAARMVIQVSLACFTMAFMLLSSLLFMPAWWEGNRPIIWITAPYLLATLILGVDFATGMQWFTSGTVDSPIGPEFVPTAAGQVLAWMLYVGWAVSILLLIIAVIKRPTARIPVAVLLGSLIGGGVIVALMAILVPGYRAAGVFSTIPVLAALAWLVTQTRLLVPTQAALALALQSLSEAVAVFDRRGRAIYLNRAATDLGIGSDMLLPELHQQHGTYAEEKEPQHWHIDERRFFVRTASIRDARDHDRGTLLLGRDVTELEQRQRQLEQEQERLQQTVVQLEREQRERGQLAETVRTLSLPVIPVMQGVLVLPLIGMFDDERIDRFNRVMLEAVENYKAHTILIDVTGVPLIDDEQAARIWRAIRAARLLGAESVLIGVRPEIAQSLVALGTNLSDVRTAATLQEAVQQWMGR